MKLSIGAGWLVMLALLIWWVRPACWLVACGGWRETLWWRALVVQWIRVRKLLDTATEFMKETGFIFTEIVVSVADFEFASAFDVVVSIMLLLLFCPACC